MQSQSKSTRVDIKKEPSNRSNNYLPDNIETLDALVTRAEERQTI